MVTSKYIFANISSTHSSSVQQAVKLMPICSFHMCQQSLHMFQGPLLSCLVRLWLQAFFSKEEHWAHEFFSSFQIIYGLKKLTLAMMTTVAYLQNQETKQNKNLQLWGWVFSQENLATTVVCTGNTDTSVDLGLQLFHEPEP